MDRTEEIKEIVRKTWRVQCMAVGDVSIDKLYEATRSGKPLDELLSSAKGGSDLNIDGTWHLLCEAFSLTADVLALYIFLKQRNESSPSKEEILQLLNESKNSYSRAVLEKLDILIDRIAKHDDN
jgi:ubiquitin-protein ligase